MTRLAALASGAEARLHNEGAPLAAIFVNGGSARAVAGSWSATSELLTRELGPRFPDITFAEVRYRVKTWNELDSCMADARAALDLVASPSLLVGFSMGGAVSIGVAAHPQVDSVLGLAPWIPERLPLDGLAGKRFDVLHGSWDRYLPGIPGVSAASSRRGFDRVQSIAAGGSYTLIPRGLHGAALRRGSGALLPLPRSKVWVTRVGERLGAFQEASRRRER